jgi:DNA (cytosine-5)-methyltransferase 1
LDIVPQKPTKEVSMGKPALLDLGMREAADYWGIEVPIARRDRKNGLRKRKQTEIEEALRYEARSK